MGVPILDNDNVILKCSGDSSENVKSGKKEETKHSNPKPAKDIIGSCKEFRIDCNRKNLRIIGNGNKIRINRNSGNIDIVGNATRLKIMNNCGAIKYTGNGGRIYLGSESPEQAVDYIGCNGILKVLNAADIRTDSNLVTERNEKRKSPSPAPSCFSSASSSDTECGKKSNSLTSFSRFSIKNNISLPNLANSSCHYKSANITNCINLSYSTGSIVIKNAINVSI